MTSSVIIISLCSVCSSSVVSVSQLLRANDTQEVKAQGNDRDFGQFMDAEPVKCAEVKVNLDKDDDLDVRDETTL